MSPRILIVEDDESMRVSVAKIVGRLGFSVCTVGSAREARERLARQPYELVLTDFRLPDADGLAVLEWAKESQPDAEVVLMTGFGSIPLAVQAIKRGAYDFISKPIKRVDLERVVRRAVEKQSLAVENRRLRQQLGDGDASAHHRIIGQSPATRELLRVIEQVAPSSATVLVTGPSGTGKELVAEAIHQLSPRRERPFIKVHCGAIPETLIEAELFGAERGAFTGAHASRDGRFAAADTGTLFLDEIGTLAPAVQVKLLRALQDGTYERLGSNRTLRSDCRIVAATNADLRKAVAEGRFREDLFFRLNVIGIAVPPLTDRREDIALLTAHFVRFYAERHQKTIEGCDPAAERMLREYDWPGNIRELQHCIERAVVLTRGAFIRVEHLSDEVRRNRDAVEESMADSIEIPVGVPLADVERMVIEQTLARSGGNQTRAASLLGISTRTIQRKQTPPRA